MRDEEKKLDVPLKVRRCCSGHGYVWNLISHDDKVVAECKDEEMADLLADAANNRW